MVPRIAARTDADGCSCLDCRNVGVQTLRRSILDALVWSGRLFRARPSILAFALFSSASTAFSTRSRSCTHRSHWLIRSDC
ncbi:hypothetical protein D8S78_04290 [Natrialba swarupiae]|nr:hypothetical protein [Natrialba swarupiae]